MDAHCVLACQLTTIRNWQSEEIEAEYLVTECGSAAVAPCED
jgi:hypothetical protein